MLTRQLIEFICQRVVSGDQLDDVKNRLIQAGWKVEDIEQAFAQIGLKSRLSQDADSLLNQIQPHRKQIMLIRKTLFVLLILLILSLVSLSGVLIYFILAGDKNFILKILGIAL